MESSTLAALAGEAIEAEIVGDSTRVLEVLSVVLNDGTKRDALAFTAACLAQASYVLTPGLAYRAWPVVIGSDRRVSPMGTARPGQQLFADLFTDFLAGAFGSMRQRWVDADDEPAAGAVGAAVAATGSLLRGLRAHLN